MSSDRDIKTWDQRLKDQVKAGWDNYHKIRIDLSTARNLHEYRIAGEFICVEDASSSDAIASVQLNRNDNDPLDFFLGVKAETVFKVFYVSNVAQQGEWLDIVMGINFRYSNPFFFSLIPAGVILLWSGSIATIPVGWALCNGANGTPDLRDRFVPGAGGAYAVGAIGGAVNHIHTGTTDGHVHMLSEGDVIVDSSPAGDISVYTYPNTDTFTTAPGDSRPLYYALAYIMKL